LLYPFSRKKFWRWRSDPQIRGPLPGCFAI
jgi:hypothetical protein